MSQTPVLQEWLKKIESFHPQEIELGLDRIRKIAEKTDCLNFGCPVIIVAGTNGKGSTVELLTQLAISHGLEVGTYTSPHLFCFNERIRINSIAVDDNTLINAFDEIEKHRDVVLSFFEFTTLAAFKIFKQRKLDLIILEVGLGGRLDAVNIIDADVAVITSIGIDHEAWLGDTREKIAIEKAGIARKGKPCVVSEIDIPLTLIPELNRIGASIVSVGNDFNLSINKHCKVLSLNVILGQTNCTLNLEVDRLRLSSQNCLGAIQAFFLAVDEKIIDVSKTVDACYKASLPARFQVFEDFPCQNNHANTTIICDLAHNPAGAQFLALQLKEYCVDHSFNKLTALCAFMRDKDIRGVLEYFEHWVDQFMFTDLPVPRAASTTEIVSRGLKDKAVRYSCYTSADEALESYLGDAGSRDLLIIFGSFHLLEPSMTYLKKLLAVGIGSIKS